MLWGGCSNGCYKSTTAMRATRKELSPCRLIVSDHTSMGSGRPAALSIPEEELRVDPHLGYPRAYGKLCRNAYAWMQLQGYVLPFCEGPPKKFLPYAAHPDDIAKLEQLHDLFPIVISPDWKKDSTHLQKYKDVIWQQLDHLGNAGFDPASFRVDAYGNVLYWHADPASPLAWEICHWFPYSRGGKTVLNNLRIVQWQVSLRRTEKLEFLIPWWDLQLGVSVNQFLSAFESTNVGFRQRCFSYLFVGGEDEMPDGKMCVNNHQWSHHFSEKRRKCGLAAAGLVRQKDGENVLKSSSAANSRPPPLPGQQKGWTAEEEEALLRGYQKFGFGRWKEIKESEPALATRSLVQIRDKYRWLTGLGKENLQSPNEKTGSSPYKSPNSRDSENNTLSEYLGNSQNDRLLSSLKRECKIQLLRGEEKQLRQGEASKLQETLNTVKLQNEKEKQALDTLEAELRRQKKLVEKQRQWNETQASYRICLERMIQETMHQSVVYKEEARLNQVACNSLMAQLESQAATCSAAESQLLKHSKERQTLLQMTRPPPLLEFATDKEGLPAIDYNQAEESSKQLARTSSNKQKNNTVRMPTRSREDRNVLQVRDLQNVPPASSPNHAAKQDSLSDSEEHHTHKRLKKSTTTPSKRYHSAPRQRPDKENSKLVVEKEPSSAKRVLKREIPGLDKLYYEGNGISRIRIGESRRTAGHGVNTKMSNSQSENEKVEKSKADDVVNMSSKADEVADVDEGSASEKVTRTFKLMPVIKRDNQNVDAGYASCGSQRFKGKDLILHAPQSRDSSERFELDVKAIDSRAPPAENNNAMVGCSSRVVAAKKNEDEQLDDLLLAAEKAQECGGGEINEDESIKQGKCTLDKWLQMLLLSTEPTMEADAQQSALEKQVVEPKAVTGEIEEIQKQQQPSSTDHKSSKIGRGWPEDIGVPPPGLIRAHSIRAAPEERPQLQPKKVSSDKIKVPFSGLFRKLSLRQQSGSGKAAAGDEEDEVPKRRQVTFEDWEGITSKLAAMHLNNNASSKAEGYQNKSSTDARKLRSTSLRASTGSLPKLSNRSSFAAAAAAEPEAPKITKSVLYYSTETFRSNKSSSSSQGEKQMASIKAMARRASINECAEAWKNEVNKLESQQQPMK